jgi:hypothetical protein
LTGEVRPCRAVPVTKSNTQNQEPSVPLASRTLLAATVAISLFAGAMPATAAPPTVPPGQAECRIPAERPVSGEAAIRALGAGLQAEAARIGRTAEALRSELRADSTLKVWRCGLFYAEALPSGDAHDHSTHEHAEGAQAAGVVVPASADVFDLSSRPSSTKTIFLDFDGHLLENSAWNSLYSLPDPRQLPAYDTDGAPASFGSDERAVIAETWARMAEDFAPFDVNVTTKAPPQSDITRTNAADQRYGVRVYFGDDLEVKSRCSCAGIAYINTFAATVNHHRHDVAFVVHLGTAKVMADIGTHEAGHTLNLLHHGTSSPDGNGGFTPLREYYAGHNAWGPLMGSATTRALSQWSRGEYTNANRGPDRPSPQDDVAILTQVLPLIADDHPDTLATARAISQNSTVAGMIHRPSDLDVFSVAANGPTDIALRPAGLGTNIDLELRIHDAAGNELSVIDPPAHWSGTGLDAVTRITLAQGTYRLAVRGVGFGDPLSTGLTGGYTNYGSLGAYTLEVTPVPITVTTASLPAARAGDAYSQQLSADDTVAPTSWRIASGTLPAGLALSSAGLLSGTPTEAVDRTLGFEVTDPTGRTATRTLSLSVTSGLPGPMFSLATTQTDRGFTVSWSPVASTAANPVSGYRVLLDGTQVHTTSQTSHTIGQLNAGSTYQVRVEAYGPGGTGTPSSASVAVITAPSVPPAPSVTRGDRNVSLSWTGPLTSSAAPVTGYRAYRDGTRIYEGPTRQFSDSALTAGQTYRYEVSTYGPLGETARRASDVTAITAPSVPPTPSATLGDRTVRLTWSGPLDSAAAPLSGYRAYRDGVRVYEGPTMRYDDSGLTAGRTYRYEISAFGPLGETARRALDVTATTTSPPPSDPPTSTPMAAPAAPSSLTASSLDRAFRLNWTAASSTSSAPVSGYRVFLDGTLAQTVTTTSATLSGLTAGRSYRLEVRSFNSAGTSSAVTLTRTAITSPIAPSSLNAAVRDRGFALSWPAVSSSTAAPVTGYRVFLDGRLVQTVTTTSATVTGLTAGQSYRLEVRAYNAAGNSAARALNRTAIRPPAAPSSIALTPSTTSVAVSWSAVSPTTAAPLTGYRVFVNGTLRATTTSRSVTISNLARRTTYRIEVRAYNGSGNGPARAASTTTR